MTVVSHRTLPAWALWLGILVPAVAAGAMAAVMTYRDITAMISATSAALPPFTITPSYYLPSAAAPAALSLLSTAVGVQLLGRSLWRPVAALALVTTWLLASGASLVYGREALAVAAIWSGPALVAMFAAWSARWASRAADPVPAATASRQLQDSSARRAATAGVVFALAVIGALIVLSAMGGLDLYFLDMSPSWWDVTSSTAAMLAPLALAGAWLAGHTPAGPHTGTWRVVILGALALVAVDGALHGSSGAVAIPVLTLLGVVVAGTRHRLAHRVEAMLRP